jgi:hypothetical protein
MVFRFFSLISTHCRVTFNCCCGDFSATSSIFFSLISCKRSWGITVVATASVSLDSLSKGIRSSRGERHWDAPWGAQFWSKGSCGSTVANPKARHQLFLQEPKNQWNSCPCFVHRDFCSVYSFSGLFKSLHVSGGPKIMSRGRLWHRLLVPTWLLEETESERWNFFGYGGARSQSR